MSRKSRGGLSRQEIIDHLLYEDFKRQQKPFKTVLGQVDVKKSREVHRKQGRAKAYVIDPRGPQLEVGRLSKKQLKYLLNLIDEKIRSTKKEVKDDFHNVKKQPKTNAGNSARR